MNRIYRLVWNRVTQSLIAVAENARSTGGAVSGARVGTVASVVGSKAPSIRTLSMALAIAYSGALQAQPHGGQVAAGTGTISQSATSTVIQQSSQNLAINWQSFGIAAGQSVHFDQPSASAIVLNRVLGQDPSQILGSLSANGQVFISNPNGVLFGAGAQVSVGGLIATTNSISDADFMAGNFRFANGGTAGPVVNQGTLTAADGGYIALLAPEVRNEGVISARLGTALLAAGERVTLNLNNGSLIGYNIDQGAVKALAENKHLIQADGGRVFLSAKAADAVSTAVVNNTGVIEARTFENRNGTIVLLGDMAHGEVQVGGTLDASARDGGNGGFIETSAAKVRIADDARITTHAPHGKTGTWLIDPTDFRISAGSAARTDSGMGADTLSAALDTTNVSIETVASGSQDGNIHVDGSVSWSANRLTLSAHGDIHINEDLHASDTAQLALEYGQATASGAGSDYYLRHGVKVNLPAGQNFFTKRGSAGTTVAYQVITALGSFGSTSGTDLQGVNGDLAGNYVLGADIDASETQYWDKADVNDFLGRGFQPIGNGSTPFSGTFDGLGHTISGLQIRRQTTSGIGLFSATSASSEIRNIGLLNPWIFGNNQVGSLVAWNQGTITNAYTKNYRLDARGYAGGLVGLNDGRQGAGRITRSFAEGTLITRDFSGGLVGSNMVGHISESYAWGSIEVYTSLGNVGGLAFENRGGSISDSYADMFILMYGGGGSAAGLVLSNAGYLDNEATITNSYARSYIDASTAYGLTSGNGAGVTNSYWNVWGGANSITGTAGTELTSAQLKQSANLFSGIATTGGTTQTWRMYEGQTAPILRYFLKPLALDNTTVAYDGTTQTGAAVPTSGAASGTAASGRNAGTYAAVSDQRGYDISGGNLTITSKTLTLSVVAADKVYDGTTAASATGTLAGVIDGDTVGSALTASFADKNAGTGKTITVTHVALSGADGGNYTVAAGQTTTADITQRALLVTATAASKVYDGTTAASATFGDNRVTGDVLTLSGSAAFTDKNAGTGKTVNVSGINVGGADAANYTFNTTAASTADITQRALLVTATAADKVYDGTTAASATGTLAGVIDGDTVESALTASFADKNAGTGKAVTVTNVALSGADGGNYTVAAGQTVIADITQRALQVTAAAASKIYDGTTAATATYGDNRIAGDVLTISGSAAFADKNAGTGKTVNVSGIDVSGADAANYTFNTTDATTADITPKALTLTALAANNKVYDGTTAASATGTLAGVIDGDTVGSGLTASFADKNAGTGKTVTVTHVALSGADGGNYTVAAGQTTTADITQRALLVTATAASKVYDGTTAASATFGDNRVTGDVLTLSGSAAFTDKNAGTGKTVNVSGINVGGADAANYTFNTTAASTADITQRALLVTATAASKVYDGTTAATATFGDNRIAGDTLVVSGTAAFADKHAGTGKTVNVSDINVAGADAANYTFSASAAATADITRRALSLSATAADKVYDGTTVATATFGDDRIAGDTLAIAGTATFDDRNVGLNKAVSITGINATGADAANYTFSTTAATTAAITPKALTVKANDASRYFDGLPYSGGNGVTITGLAGGDTDAVLNGMVTYGGSAQGAVNPGRFTITPGGLGATNYAITHVDGTLVIVPAGVVPGIPFADQDRAGAALAHAHDPESFHVSQAIPNTVSSAGVWHRGTGAPVVDVVNGGMKLPRGVN